MPQHLKNSEKVCMRKICVLLFAAPLLSMCNFDEQKEVIEIEVPEITHHNYFEIENKSVLWSQVFEVDKSNYFVYYYSPTCSHCAELKDWIIEKALELGNVYFVKESAMDVISKDVSESIGARTVDKISIQGYPSLLQIENKTVIKNAAGKTQIQNILNKV